MVALRRLLWPALAGLLALLLSPGFGTPQPPPPVDRRDEKDGKEIKPLTLPADPGTVAVLEAAADYIEEKEWVEALRVLQKLLSHKEDRLLPPRGKGAGTWRSARAEALRLMANLPPEGREFYQLNYGPKADALLKAALKDNKPEELAQVAAEYLYTDAGLKALAALAARAAEAKQYDSAALYYGQLLRHRGVDRWAPADLFQATLAFRRAGDRERADVTGKELLSRVGREGLRLGKTKYDREGLAKELARMGPPPIRDEWPVYGGNAARSDQGIGGPPFMTRLFKQPTVETEETTRFLKQAERQLQQKTQPVLPASYPIAVVNAAPGRAQPLVVFRSYYGIRAVDGKAGKVVWDSPSTWGLDRTLARGSDARKIQAMTNWLNYYVNQNVRPQIVFENSVLGALSTDGAHVYAVEDLAVPPSPGARNAFQPGYNPGLNYGAEVNDWTRHNRLQAMELATNGKLKWEVGGRGKGDLDDTFFLSAPLPVEGKLYVLTQKDTDLRLAVLNPRDGKLLSLHKLATLSKPLSEDPIRRTQAAHLAYSQGTLVCPTNAGAVIGFDLLAGRIAWAYSYAEPAETPAAPRVPPAGFRRGGIPPGWMMLPDGRMVPIAGLNTEWRVTAPVIADGKVVFAAPDAKSVHCLNLADGTRAWSQKRSEDDLYLGGVFAGRVLIVGKKSVRGLSLARGTPLWTLETGLPSGQGVASEDVYYLPLKEATRTKEPEVCAIDLRRGVIRAHTRSRQKDVPGNLLFIEGNVISQTATEVVAYPQLKVAIARMDERIAKNANDPTGLVLRAELRLDSGDLSGAVNDLRKALAEKAAGDMRDRARALLYQVLTEGLQRDFGAFEKYLAEYEALSKEGVEDKAEAQKRLSNYYLLVGKGREVQGKVVEALKAYLALAELGPGDELVSLPDEPAVRLRRDLWVRVRIGELFLKATPEQRKQLEEEVGRRRKALRGGNNVQGLRGFVALFGTDTPDGRAARLELARLLIEKEDYPAAEQLLQELRRQRADTTLAARAVLELGRLATRRGLLADAVYYYRTLARDFPRTAVEGKKTGADLFEELQTDKRFLPFLMKDQKEAPAFPAGTIRATEERGSFPYSQQVYHFPHAGESLPFFLRNRLALNLAFHKLQVLDGSTGEERWGVALTRTMFQQMMYANGQSHQVRFPFQSVGHLVVLPVGHMVFGIDPVGRRVLWEKSLVGKDGPQTPNGPQYIQLAADPRDGSLRVNYADGWVQRLGVPLALSPEVLCLQTNGGLQGIDPLTGKALWSRDDVPSNTDIFTDGRTAYVVVRGPDNQPKATRAFRLADGGEVRVPGFEEAYRHRLRVVGHHILVSDTDADDRVRLRLYDVRAGKDVWVETYPAKAFVLRSAAPGLTGAVLPDGTVHVLDVASGKELLKPKMGSQYLVKVDEVRLLADAANVCVACVGAADPNITAFGGVRSNLMPGTGLRALPVNGQFYAFNRATGKVRWYVSMPNQMLVLNHFEELPVVLFTSTYQKWAINGAARNVQQVTAARAVEKRTGKPVYANDSLPNGMSFHTLKVDAARGSAELVGFQVKVRFSVAGEKSAPGAGK
jgi:outer membrane protein assembly factor BamB/tetratricopeptide (TPR) repeat protein